jgi:hypothetical protein
LPSGRYHNLPEQPRFVRVPAARSSLGRQVRHSHDSGPVELSRRQNDDDLPPGADSGWGGHTQPGRPPVTPAEKHQGGQAGRIFPPSSSPRRTKRRAPWKESPSFRTSTMRSGIQKARLKASAQSPWMPVGACPEHSRRAEMTDRRSPPDLLPPSRR